MKTSKIAGNIIKGIAATSLALVAPLSGVAQARDELTVAYFLEWPTPNQVAQLEETYDKTLGVKVNWRAFDNGNAMSAAMASGDVQIAYSQGLTPFIVAATKGLPIKIVGIAVEYAGADNCVVHNNAKLDRSTAESTKNSLKGMKIATPVGNVTHYKLLRTLEYFGVKDSDVSIVPVSGGADAAAAFLSGQVDIGCAFGGPLDKMKGDGRVLMTGTQQENVGILTFDVISVTEEFANEDPDMLVKFLQVTEDANRKFADNPNPHWGTLQKASGLDETSVKQYLGSGGSFSFPSKESQLSSAWMGGTVQSLSKETADFLAGKGTIDGSLASYDGVVDASYLSKVK
ncbi:MAG: ABC transporter substrate-binding protein [Gammaproteobacteria bacterium WSBS_2016_MAG_OTU1]